jgi:hypothetical protein
MNWVDDAPTYGDIWESLTDEQKRQLDASTQNLYGTPAAEAMTAMAGQHRLLEKGGHRVRLPARGLERISHAMGKKAPPYAPEPDESPVIGWANPPGPPPPVLSPPRPVTVVARVRFQGEADDPVLNRHCTEVRRDFAVDERIVVAVTMDWMTWPFPTFAPRARPFDWTVDEAL